MFLKFLKKKYIILSIILIGLSNLSGTKSKVLNIEDSNINKVNKLKLFEIKYSKNFANAIWEPFKGNFNETKQLIWEDYTKEDIFLKKINSNKSNQESKKFSISSLNRSIIFNEKYVGPDISWLVPPGLKWNRNYKFDFSVRGNSGLENNNKFLAWNEGDAVGQYYYQFLNNKNSSFGLNVGMRSIQGNPNIAGGHTKIGEGISAGFRYDYKITNLSGIAIGGEQILHFDGLTDTGRDFYITATKAWLNKENKDNFPIYLVTGGFATGKMAEGNIKGLCSNLLGGSGTEIAHQRQLCWAPVFTLSKVYNSHISNFFEYNSKHFLFGTSLAPFNKIPLRGTFAFVLSDHIDNYKFHEFNEIPYVFRLSLGF